MYMPYLRGKMYELIALKELIENELITDKILPIIEPVKNNSTLLKTLEAFAIKQHKIAVILNPYVGEFSYEDDKFNEQFEKILSSEYVQPALIFDEHLQKNLTQFKLDLENTILINTSNELLEKYESITNGKYAKYVLHPDNTMFKRKMKKNKVLLSDKFKKQSKNAAYSENEYFFSSDHLFFAEEGYEGFSDYSVIGEDFSEKGFAPYAVAIHIVFLNDQEELWIKHFISDSNDDPQNPALKFFEAVNKITQWDTPKNISTYGFQQFLDHQKNQTYPGLGTVKKLSVMHHIELLSKFMEK